MAVKVDNSNRSVGPIYTAQQRQGNGMVSSQGDDAWKGLSSLGESVLLSIGEWFAH